MTVREQLEKTIEDLQGARFGTFGAAVPESKRESAWWLIEAARWHLSTALMLLTPTEEREP